MDAVAAGTERFETVVIGGGQTGLSVGYHLARRGLPFVILDAGERIGDAWRNRWDSLRLFTPARYDGLDGMPFPAPPDTFPTKEEFADYLETYAEHFELPVRLRTRVERLWREDGRYVMSANGRRLEADNVVVAMGTFQEPRFPAFADQLDPGIVQLHSARYRNPGQLQDGDVLLVGAGNSGSEIAMELANGRQVWMAGRDVGAIPFRIEKWFGRTIGVPFVLRFLFRKILSVRTPIGRKVRPKMLSKGGPLVRVKPADLDAAGIERVGRVERVNGNGLPVLDDGRELDVANVIWCTGFHPGFSWIDMPIHGEHEPDHQAGVVPEYPGLYFVGLHFLSAMSSEMIHGVGDDADRIAGLIEQRTAERAPSPAVAPVRADSRAVS